MGTEEATRPPSDTSDETTSRVLQRRLDLAVRELDKRWDDALDDERRELAATIEHLATASGSLPMIVEAPPVDGDAVAVELWQAATDAGASAQIADAVAERAREVLA